MQDSTAGWVGSPASRMNTLSPPAEIVRWRVLLALVDMGASPVEVGAQTPDHAHLVCDGAPLRLSARLKRADEHPPVELGSALLGQFGSFVALAAASHTHAAKKQ